MRLNKNMDNGKALILLIIALVSFLVKVAVFQSLLGVIGIAASFVAVAAFLLIIKILIDGIPERNDKPLDFEKLLTNGISKIARYLFIWGFIALLNYIF